MSAFGQELPVLTGRFRLSYCFGSCSCLANVVLKASSALSTKALYPSGSIQTETLFFDWRDSLPSKPK